ncbi:arylesterase [Ideonella sp. BN130291]|uniref:arylesterase n=1 Tax=Ideonella sp. BN130291 TaxID=3112940 RepID=UPI002E26D1DE|nr:arylesterase [Ideonella sp. BN130291]
MTSGKVEPHRATRRAWLLHCSALWLAGTSAAPAATQPKRILVVGDSLSAEYGLARGTGWVALLERKLAQERIAASVVNASISGDTTAGGRSRLPALLVTHKPTHVVLELGANDALRGLPLATTRKNLDDMVAACKASGARVLLVGMRMPPNYGRKYSDEFVALYGEVARQQGAQLVPFLLKDVADAPNADALFQADRMHPRAEAHPVMLNNVWTGLRPLLAS